MGSLELHLVGTAQGRVVAPSGQPVEGAEIVWRPECDAGGRLVPVAPERHSGVRTDVDGRFHVIGPPTGRVRFAAISPRGSSAWTHPYRIAGFDSDAEPWRIRAYRSEQQVNIVLAESAVVRGQLIDDDSRMAVEGRVVALPYHSAPWIGTATGADGRFELRSLLPGKRYILLATSPGYFDLRLERPVVVGKALDVADVVSLELARASAFAMHVRDGRTLEPIEGAAVFWTRPPRS